MVVDGGDVEGIEIILPSDIEEPAMPIRLLPFIGLRKLHRGLSSDTPVLQ